MIFPLFVSITIMRTPKIWDSSIYISFHFILISISIYITSTKVKSHGVKIKISVQETQKLPKRISKAPNRGSWRSCMLPNYCEICPIASRLSHEPNTSDETRIGLWMGLKQALNQNCTGCWNNAAQRAAQQRLRVDLIWSRLGSARADGKRLEVS